jgi:regulator of protease activity HflC (stomatin/prohibitin superfamily)
MAIRMQTCCGLLAATALLTSCAHVPVGSVGLKVNLYGGGRGEPTVVEPGRVVYNPFTQEVYEYPIIEQYFNQSGITFNVNGATVRADIAGSYRTQKESVADLFKRYRVAADEYRDTFATTSIVNCFNAEGSDLKPEALITSARNQLLLDVEACFNQKNPGVVISNLGFVGSPQLPNEIQASITARLQADQERERQQAALEVQRIENQKEIEQARADAEVARLQAQSVTRETIELQRLTIQQLAIEKWDGNLPQMVTGGDIPFVQNLGEAGNFPAP